MFNLHIYRYPFLVFIIIAGFLWHSLDLSAKELPHSLIGKKFPTFNLPNLIAHEPELQNEIFKGKISVVHVWASWCGACRKDQKFLTALKKSDDYQLVGIDYKDSRHEAENWLNKLGDPYTVNIYDHHGRLGVDLGLYGTPTTYIVDQDGVIRFRHVGTLTKEYWNNKILAEIKKLKA